MESMMAVMIEKNNQTRTDKNAEKDKRKHLKAKKNTKSGKTLSSKINDLFYDHCKIAGHTWEKC